MMLWITGKRPGLVVLDERRGANPEWSIKRERHFIDSLSPTHDLLNAKEWSIRRERDGVPLIAIQEYKATIYHALLRRAWDEELVAAISRLEDRHQELDLVSRSRVSFKDLQKYDWETEQRRIRLGEDASEEAFS